MDHTQDHYSKKELLQYLNIELYVDDLIKIERHINQCPKCSTLADSLQSKSTKVAQDHQFERWINPVPTFSTPQKNHKNKIFPLFAIIGALGIGLILPWQEIFQLAEKLFATSSDSQKSTTFLPILEDSTRYESSTTLLPKVQQTDSSQQVYNTITAIEASIDSTRVDIKDEKAKSDQPIIKKAHPTPSEKPTLEKSKLNSNPKKVFVTKTPKIEVQDTSSSKIEKTKTVTSIVISELKSESPTPIKGYQKYNQYISNRIAYPKEAISNQVSGEVVVSFTVIEGRISQISFKNRLGHQCEELISDLLKSGPTWQSYISKDYVELNTAQVKFTFNIEQVLIN